jgi:hypothetical protein
MQKADGNKRGGFMANDILYDLTPWEDAPSTLTPINAENLNARDRLLKKVVDKTNELSGQKVDKQDGYSMVSDSEKQAWNNKSDFSGSYNDLTDKPEIPEGADLTGYATEDYVKDYAQPKGNYLTEHQDLSGYALKEEIPTVPEKLPNPNPLTFTGAVTGSYDGSEPLSVEIPSGGGGEQCDLLMDVVTTERVVMVTQDIDNVAYKQIVVVCEHIKGHSENNTNAYQLTVYLTNNQNVEAAIAADRPISQGTTDDYAKYNIHLTDKYVIGDSYKNQNNINGIGLAGRYMGYQFIPWESNVLKRIEVGSSSRFSNNTMEVGATIKVWGVRA